ncbi:MAG: hypothetical protein IJ503_09690 [Akkermansia sp.]|nr:hypothetical protein [Akkermansia sp.]
MTMPAASLPSTKDSGRQSWLLISGVWLGLNALVHLFLFPFLLYTGLCTLLMPFSLWILSSLTTSTRTYALLNIPLMLYTLAWWFTTPLMGCWFTLLWLPFIPMGFGGLRCRPGNSLTLQCVLYLVALLPYIAMLPFLIFVLRDFNR